jgi:hypothetical protein
MWKGIIKKYVGKCKVKGCKNQANPDISEYDGAGEVIVDLMRASGRPYKPHHFCDEHQTDFLAMQQELYYAGGFEDDMSIARQVFNEYKHLSKLEPLEEGE